MTYTTQSDLNKKGTTVMIVTNLKNLEPTSRDISIRVEVSVLVDEPDSENRFEAGDFTRQEIPKQITTELITRMLNDLPQLLRKSALPNSHSYKVPVVTHRAEPLTAEISHRISPVNSIPAWLRS